MRSVCRCAGTAVQRAPRARYGGAVTSPDPLVARLRRAGCVFAEDEARLLREAASGAELEALVARRVAGAPLEVLLGWADFAGLRVAIAPGVFVPRRRSELLARLAAEALPPGGVVVELCCGVGAIAAAVRARRPDVEVHACDIDPDAVAVARRNLPPGSVHAGDLYAALPAALRGRVDVLVANAPYVPTAEIPLLPPEAREHEHRVALDGGPDGHAVQARIASGCRAWLAPAGRVVIETSRRQAPRTAALLAEQGLAVRVVRDEERDGTAVVGTPPAR